MNIFGFQLRQRFIKGRTVLKKAHKNVNMDDFAEVEFSQRQVPLSFFIRIGWIPPKRLRSKFEVSAADTHIHTYTHTHTHTHSHSPTNPHSI